MTPYKAAKLVNLALKENGIDKEIPPQMMYNYTSKGFIKKNADGTVNEESFAKWLQKYLEKQGVKVVTPAEDFAI